MSGASDFTANTLLDDLFNGGSGFAHVADPYLQLHSGDPGVNGTTNIVDIARVQFATGAAAARTLSNSANIDFTTMPSVPSPGVVAWSVWDTADATPTTPAGNCLWTGWFTTVYWPFTIESVDYTNNDVTAGEHGFIANDRVVFETVEGSTLPSGMTAGTLYHVISTGLATDTFRFSATQGGGAVDITDPGPDAGGVVRKVPENPVNVGNTFRVNAGDLDFFA